MPRTVASDKVHEFFRWVRERSALVVGIVDSSTSRDEAWQFFTLGRSIERADMTARLLATRSLTEARGPSWTTILRSCGAYEAYLRTYRGVPSARNAAEFLLLDRLFPRVDHVLGHRAEECLREIEPRSRPRRRHATRRSGCSARSAPSWSTARSPTSSTTCPRHMDDVQRRRAPRARRSASATSRRSAAPSWIGEIS